eukprot:9293593-Alexandrium_andersonii.AAC.1
MDRYGQPIRELFGRPEPQQEGCFRLPWAAYDHTEPPSFTPGAHWPAPQAERAEAWHGCKLEALNFICFHGKQVASRPTARGSTSEPGSMSTAKTWRTRLARAL